MQIDLNADLGEGCGQDQELLSLVSSANISCGAHAGDAESISQALRGAREQGVAVGAHPGYADPGHFGRRPLELSFSELSRQLQDQLEWLRELARAQQVRLVHIKPHGALYNQAAKDPDLARQLVSILSDFDPSLVLVGPAGSSLLEAGEEAGLKTRSEVFADRRYDDEGRLLPRSDPRALIEDSREAVEQSLRLITRGQATSVGGRNLELRAETLCLHGDTPDALRFARQLRDALRQARVTVTSGEADGTGHAPHA